MSRFDALPVSPFTRLNKLLEGVAPGAPPIHMHIGEPQHAVPAFVGEILAKHTADFGRYPPIIGPEPVQKPLPEIATSLSLQTVCFIHVAPLKGASTVRVTH